MDQGFSEEAKKIRTPAIKVIIFFAFLALAFYLARLSPAKDYFTPQALDHFLKKAGLWAPLGFILIYAAGVCLLLPGTFFSFLGVALFGGFEGFLYVYLGAMAGATAAFWIGRTLGRDFAAFLIGKRLKKYDDAIARHGFAAVLYLRLIHFPFSVMNFGMGLTKVSFRDYFWGTGWGILVGVFIFTFFLGTLREVWAGGEWPLLFSLRVFFSLGLFVFSFFIPKIIRKLRKGKEFWDSDILE